MLFSLSQQQLSHVLLPLGGVSKDEIRRLAAEAGLVTAQKPDSRISALCLTAIMPV